MNVDYPKTHDPAPVFAQAVRTRGMVSTLTFWTPWRRGTWLEQPELELRDRG